MLGDSSEPIGRRYMNLLYRAGYDYMELPLAQIMELSEAGFEELLSQIQESGIPCECCNNFFPASVRLTGEEADPPKISEYVKGAMDRAVRLGAKIIVFGSSGAKMCRRGLIIAGLSARRQMRSASLTLLRCPRESASPSSRSTAGKAILYAAWRRERF